MKICLKFVFCNSFVAIFLSHAAFMWLTSKDLSLMRIFAAATEAWRGRRAGDGM